MSGMIYGLTASFAVSLFSILTSKGLVHVDGSVWRLTFYNNFNSSLLFILGIVITGEMREFQYLPPTLRLDLNLCCYFAFFPPPCGWHIQRLFLCSLNALRKQLYRRYCFSSKVGMATISHNNTRVVCGIAVRALACHVELWDSNQPSRCHWGWSHTTLTTQGAFCAWNAVWNSSTMHPLRG